MNELAMTVILVGNLTVTSYQSIPAQTDSTPFHTSTGERVRPGGAAISQDLLCGACRKLHQRCDHPTYPNKIHYGDLLYVQPVGFVIVNDCMGKFKRFKIKTKLGLRSRFKKQETWIDIWVPSYKDERTFHKRNGITKHAVWRYSIPKEN